MPEIVYEIRIVKITHSATGAGKQETLYVARTETVPDLGPVIAALNPSLVLPLVVPTKFDGRIVSGVLVV